MVEEPPAPRPEPLAEVAPAPEVVAASRQQAPDFADLL